jgi:hypothetical protein
LASDDGLGLIQTGSEVKEALPFSDAKQKAFFGHLVTNEQWFVQCVEVVQKKWFMDPRLGDLWGIAQESYRKYHTIPTLAELFENPDFLKHDGGTRNRVKVLVEECKSATLEYRLHTFQDEMTSWMKALLYQTGLDKTLRLYNQRQPEKAFAVLEEVAQEIKEVSFTPRNELSFLHPELQITEASKGLEGALTFGHRVIDNALLRGNASGSLLPSNTTTILAPTGAGKTTAMITIANSNVRLKKDVLLLTHEGSQLDIYEKIYCNFLGITKDDYYQWNKDPEKLLKLKRAGMFLSKHLRFHHMVKAGLTVEEVGAVVTQMQQEKIAKTGKGFDLVLDDYPAKLCSDRLGKVTRREIDEYVYNYMARLAEENNFHLVNAIQTNRTGSRINKGQKGYDDRLLTHEDVMESFAAMTPAANIITINRDHYSEHAEFVTFYVSKSRSNETGTAIVCRSRYSCARTHWHNMAAMWYKGNVPLGSQIETLASHFADGQMVPRELFG